MYEEKLEVFELRHRHFPSLRTKPLARQVRLTTNVKVAYSWIDLHHSVIAKARCSAALRRLHWPLRRGGGYGEAFRDGVTLRAMVIAIRHLLMTRQVWPPAACTFEEFVWLILIAMMLTSGWWPMCNQPTGKQPSEKEGIRTCINTAWNSPENKKN